MADRRRRPKLGRSARVWAVLACAMLLVPAPAQAIGPAISGAGSTWVQIALDQWRADIARQGYLVNFQGVGSSAGRQFYIINQVDFAASEIPFQPDEVAQLQAEHKSYQYLPDVAGGTSLMYNLHTPSGNRITNLRLDADTSARIFTGRLTSWHDPAIQALNPGLQIRENNITAVIRSDGSGTSAQFSLYLQDQGPAVWNAFVNGPGQCPAPCSQWPVFANSTQQSGSDGVANFVANDATGSGAIGYVEAGYAFGRRFPVASLHNASGNFVQPTSDNVSTALRHATLRPDLTQNLINVYRAPEPNAYPMSSYSYLITQTSGFDPAKGAVLGTWIIYIACAGQRQAAPLGYSPLPPNLIQADFDAVTRIPGHPTPPPLDYQHCPNPTLAPAGSAGAAAASAGAVGAPSSAGSQPLSTGQGAAAPQAATSALAGSLPAGSAAAQIAASLPAGASAQDSASVESAASAAAAADQVAAALGDAPAATSGPSTAAASAGRRALGVAVVSVMDQAHRQALLDAAESAASRVVPPQGVPLAAAAAVILLLVFAPVLLDRKSFSRGR